MINATDIDEKVDAGNMLGKALKSIFAIAENYPDLKASENFKLLQEELASIENKIAYARQHFNDSVLEFNNTIEAFPGNIFAGIMGKKERKMLEIATAEKELPKVSF
jgi:LemA protein